MATPKKLRGIVGYPVTPMKGDGKEIDEERLRTLLDFLIQNKVRGLVVVGSTGSIGSFDEDERRRIAEVAVEHVKDRVPIFVGTGSMKTEQAVRLSRHAEKIGADGVQVVAMAHWPLTEAELYGYYRDIASAVSIPILVHNVPALSGMDSEAAVARPIGADREHSLPQGGFRRFVPDHSFETYDRGPH